METIVEFTIADTRCRVVAQDPLEGDRPAQRAGANGMQVVGNCSLRGRRYLILSAAPEPTAGGACPNGVKGMLTPRELQVASLVADGMGNKQIAYRLHLSEWTVSSYIRRVFVKLGVRTRAAMVARLLVEG